MQLVKKLQKTSDRKYIHSILDFIRYHLLLFSVCVYMYTYTHTQIYMYVYLKVNPIPDVGLKLTNLRSQSLTEPGCHHPS